MLSRWYQQVSKIASGLDKEVSKIMSKRVNRYPRCILAESRKIEMMRGSIEIILESIQTGLKSIQVSGQVGLRGIH